MTNLHVMTDAIIDSKSTAGNSMNDKIKVVAAFILFFISLNSYTAALPDSSQNNTSLNCVDLEKSGVSSKAWDTYIVSDNGRLVASYAEYGSKKQSFIRLWETLSGKLLETKTIDLFGEHHARPGMFFSPNNRFFYLTDLIVEDSDYSNPRSIIPFWNLTTNQLIISSCERKRSLFEVLFSDDGKVALTRNEDPFRATTSSLCSTFEKKLFAKGRPADFDPETKQLFDDFSSKDYRYFHELNEHLKQAAANEKVTQYKLSSPDKPIPDNTGGRDAKSLLALANNERPFQKLRVPPHLVGQADNTQTFTIPGGYEDDQYYKKLHA